MGLPGMSQVTTDPGDLFVQEYDRLDDSLFAGPREAERLYFDDSVKESAEQITALVLANGVAPEREVNQLLEDTSGAGALALLIGLDDALEYLNPFSSLKPPESLDGIAGRALQEGRLNTGEGDGALLFRYSFPGRPSDPPTKSQFFKLVRIPPAMWEKGIQYTPLQKRYELVRRRGSTTVRVACIPMLDSCTDFAFETGSRNRRAVFRMRPRHTRVLTGRIDYLVRELDRSGADVALLPESSLSPRLLKLWQRTLSNIKPGPSRLKWILAGSGPLGGSEGEGPRSASDPPLNRAVVLERNSGRVILSHNKTKPFSFSARQLKEWGLVRYLGTGKRTEDLWAGDKVTIAESSRMGRIGLIICEDLARPLDVGLHLKEFAVSHLFVPIFSKPIENHGWEERAAGVYVFDIGAWVIVTNSLVVGRAMGQTGPINTSVLIGPKDPQREEWDPFIKWGSSDSPDSISFFEVPRGETRHWSEYLQPGS